MKTFKIFLLENTGEVKYSSTQINLPLHLASQIQHWARTNIKQEHLEPEEGLETENHCTALYGLHTTNPAEVEPVVKGFGPISLTLGDVSMFAAKKGDVLKFDVHSPDMHRLNEHLRKHLKYSTDFPEYIPHITIGYLITGNGSKYVGDSPFKGKVIKSHTLQFSTPNPGRKKYYLDLK